MSSPAARAPPHTEEEEPASHTEEEEDALDARYQQLCAETNLPYFTQHETSIRTLLMGIQFGFQTYCTFLNSIVGYVASNMTSSSSVLRDIAKKIVWRLLCVQQWIIYLKAQNVFHIDHPRPWKSGSALRAELIRIGKETQAEFITHLENEKEGDA